MPPCLVASVCRVLWRRTYPRAQRGGDVVAVPFDERSRSVLTFPAPVSSLAKAEAAPAFALARAGTLVHAGHDGKPLQITLDWKTKLVRLAPHPPPALPR